MTLTRTDDHRPSAIIPDDYEYVAFEHVKIEGLGDCEYALQQRRIIKAHMTRTGGTYSNHEHGGNCHICGNANAMYTVLFYHAKSNTYIRTGQDCAEKMDMACGQDWNVFRKAVRSALELRAGKKKAEAVLNLEGLSLCWTIYTSTVDCTCEWSKRNEPGFIEPNTYCSCLSMFERSHKEETTIKDIVGKLVKYGSVSEAQTNFLRSLVGRIANRPAIEAKREAERLTAADCPTGRVQVTGTVLTIREDENDFGKVTRMLFKDDSGFRLWGTRPSYTNVEPGDRLTFSANITPSDKDAKFGFYKRPTKADVLERKERAQ